MGNCGTKEESAVVATHVQVQQMFSMPVKNASLEKKHNRSFSDLSDINTPHKFEVSRNISIYTNLICFRSDYILGERGFGTVYKGYIDENVRVGLKSLPVAVKVLNKDGLQGHRDGLAEGAILYPGRRFWKILDVEDVLNADEPYTRYLEFLERARIYMQSQITLIGGIKIVFSVVACHHF